MNEPNCPVCGEKFKLVPAGVSRKTGNSYKAFYSCVCGKTAPASQPTPTQGNSTAGFDKVSYQTELLVLNEILAELKKIEENTRPKIIDIPIVEE